MFLGILANKYYKHFNISRKSNGIPRITTRILIIELCLGRVQSEHITKPQHFLYLSTGAKTDFSSADNWTDIAF